MNQYIKRARSMFGLALALGLPLGVLGNASDAEAATATSNMTVSATVGANCTISAGSLPFGTYDPISANAASALNGSATIAVACTTGASTTITLGQGANASIGSSDAVPLRRLNVGSSYLSYSLYTDSTRLLLWGNTALTGKAYTGVGTSENVTVYGSVAAAQNVPAGTYTDTVVATITF